jgi:hypothetical protein
MPLQAFHLELRGLPQSKQAHTIKPLTCAFAPPAGLEPATYGLVLQPHLAWIHRGLGAARHGSSEDHESAWAEGRPAPVEPVMTRARSVTNARLSW